MQWIEHESLEPPAASTAKPTMSHNPFKALLKGLIRGYQLLISPVLGSNCRFYPTCSCYTLEAIETHGAGRGLYLGARRLLRCHPFHAGGIDLVPPPSGRCRGGKGCEKTDEPPV